MSRKKSTTKAGKKRTDKNVCATKSGDLDAPPPRVSVASAGEVKAQAVKTTASEASCLASRSGARAKKPAKRRAPRNHRGLAKAVFAKSNMVTIGQELLQSKSATVKARVWETLVHYALGEFAPVGGEAAAPANHLGHARACARTALEAPPGRLRSVRINGSRPA